MFSEFAEVSAATWGVIVALLLVGIIVFAVSKDKKRWTARMLANGALCIALATVLSFVTLYKCRRAARSRWRVCCRSSCSPMLTAWVRAC